MSFIINPDAEEFVPAAEEKHHNTGERGGYSLRRGEVLHRLGKQTPPTAKTRVPGLG